MLLYERVYSDDTLLIETSIVFLLRTYADGAKFGKC